MVLVLVCLGELVGTGSNETVGGGGGRGGGVHKAIRDAVDAALFSTRGEHTWSTGVCEPDCSADVDSDTSDKICTAESDLSRRGSTGEDDRCGITVLEDSSFDEALAFGILILDGDNNVAVGLCSEGCDSD